MDSPCAVFILFRPPFLPSFNLALQMSELEAMSEELGSEPTKIAQSSKAAEALADKEAPLQPDLNSTVAEKT